MMRFLITIIFAFCWLGVNGQNTEIFRRNLATPDSVYGARVTVMEDGAAEALVDKLDSPGPDEKKKGYRVCIFLDSNQQARSEALAAEERFKELFPGIPTYRRYETPDWKVLVGNCITIEEVTMLKGKVEKLFSKAFLVREDIPLSEFGK